MDSVKDANNSSKKALKLLLSVSAISFMYSYSSLLLPFLVNSLTNVYFSTFTKQPSSLTSPATLDKSYVFLLFNGILVIIVKNSGLIGNNKSPELDFKTNDHVSSTIMLKTTPGKVSFDSERVEDDHGEAKEREHSQNGQLSKTEELNDINEEKVEEVEELNENNEEKVVEQEEEEEEEEEEAIELPSSDSEEFNKKCEDFIRRVREEIMLGAL